MSDTQFPIGAEVFIPDFGKVGKVTAVDGDKREVSIDGSKSITLPIDALKDAGDQVDALFDSAITEFGDQPDALDYASLPGDLGKVVGKSGGKDVHLIDILLSQLRQQTSQLLKAVDPAAHVEYGKIKHAHGGTLDDRRKAYVFAFTKLLERAYVLAGV